VTDDAPTLKKYGLPEKPDMHDICVPQTIVSWKLRLAVIDESVVTVPVYVTVHDPTDDALTAQ
jgi:hypothetical protein